MRHLALRRIERRRLAEARDPVRLAEIAKLREEGHVVLDFPGVMIVIMNFADGSKRTQARSGEEEGSMPSLERIE